MSIPVEWQQPIGRLKRFAARNPWKGKTPLPDGCRLLLYKPVERERMFSILCSFDVGYHSSGWWRNSLYERCWHLSVCVVTNQRTMETPTISEVQEIARAFFGTDVQYGWVEPPASAFDAYRTAPSSRHTYHVRIFTDLEGNAIMPKGEVYDLVPFDDGSSPEKVFR